MNIVPIGIFLYMSIFMFFNRNYEPELTKKFVPLVILLFINILIDNYDQHLYMQRIGDIRHIAMGVFGYNVRIGILMGLIWAVLRKNKSKLKYLLFIPCIASCLVTPLAFFTKLVFWYDDKTGVLLRGPLSFTPHIALGIYGLIIIIYGIYLICHKNMEEGLIMIIGVVLAGFATYAEAKYLYRGLLIGVTALVITFYYLYVHTEYLKKDILTDTFNRVTYKADIQKIDEIKHIIMIDLNNLKILNDTRGHEEGDKALKTLAEKVKDRLPKKCTMYRIGGDEFAVLCKKEIDVITIVEEIRSAMTDTPYQWAVGYSDIIDNNYEASFKKADARMYEEKLRMKAVRTV